MGYLQEAENISIHAPTRGATYTADVIGLRCGFQSTLPRGERHAHLRQSCCSHDFNPRSHEGSDSQGCRVSVSPRISIHAPTRGATVHISGNFTVAMISIHAPTRGATKYRVCAFTVHRFQSTLPRGERHVRFFNVRDQFRISIHAPTRGATSQSRTDRTKA